MQTFKARLEPVSGGGHFVVVPEAVAAAAGLRYGVRVRGTVNGVAYRSSLMKYSGVFHMGVHKATLAAAGVAPGTPIDVAIEIDDQPLPTDTMPADLKKALTGAAKAAWEKLPPSHKREHVKHVLEAKKPETRARRIAATIATLTSSAKAAPSARARGSAARPRVKSSARSASSGARRARGRAGRRPS
jgi:hypothetical protein